MNRKKQTLSSLATLAVIAVILTNVGCERRSFYRQQADRESALIINETTCIPEWQIDNFTIDLDPRSRYFDEFQPDCVPMPQDDPYSNEFMHNVDGKRGWAHWNRNGRREDLEASNWREQIKQYMPTSEDGKIILDVNNALQLAQIHSTSYQQQLETLYLSSLDVSTERFRFDTQFFGGSDVAYSHLGAERTGFETNTLTANRDLELRKTFATAGQMVIGFANNFVWQFTGTNSDSAVSLLNFSLVQPLLRNGGRVIALETLTIVERALLANLRAFQRYRRGFYTQIAIGQSGVSGPQRRGGFQGGTGLTGFTGTGAGGIGGVAAGTFGGFGGGGGGVGGGGAGAGLAGGGAGNVGGFIGLLQSLQEYRNARDSLDLQLRTLALLEGNLDAGLIDLTQVDQFRQSIETQRAQLLQTDIALTNSIEGYITGNFTLPPDLEVQLDDSFIEPFQLIDPKMTEYQNDIYLIQDAIGVLPEEISDTDVRRFAQQAEQTRAQVQQYSQQIQNEITRLDSIGQKRKPSMDAEDIQIFEKDVKELKDTVTSLSKRLVESRTELEKVSEGLSNMNAEDRLGLLVIWLREFLTLQQEIVLIQARGRLESVYVDPIELTSDQAVEIARSNRLDWMNNRASLVDTWRLIEFNANRLKSDLQVTINGDLRSSGDNLARISADNSSLSMGLRFDAPFTRLLERNNYRQALIDYQQSRRRLIQFEDGVNSTMRQTLRQLDQLRTNLEIQRRAVAISIRRVDFTQAELNKPLPLPVPGQAQPTFGPTAVNNLLSALADLRNSQNNFMSVWLNYYATRMSLMRDLGIMKLDQQGRWIDVPFNVNDYLATSTTQQAIPEIPNEWMIPGAEIAPQIDPTVPSGTVYPEVDPSLGAGQTNTLDQKLGLSRSNPMPKVYPSVATQVNSNNGPVQQNQGVHPIFNATRRPVEKSAKAGLRRRLIIIQ